MLKKTAAEVPYYEFEIFQPFADTLRHAIFTRHTDVTDGIGIQRLLQSSSLPCSFEKQLHGTDVWVVKKPETGKQGDILITNVANSPLLIRIADCASIMLFDPMKKIIANIHAGWRGLAARAIRKTIQALRERFGSESKNLHAGISPMLGPCCSHFSDPKNELPKFMHQFITEENTVNLWAAAETQLAECGIPKNNIENPRICTFCNPEEFFSYRREGDKGRFGTAIMLR